jgi:rSAM/selenodomain-associated transferase 2/rSAM/selenodomain-associated transferase 1
MSRASIDRLMVFTRWPQLGRVKTRLIPALGAAGAAELQRKMTERTLAWARRLARRRPLNLEVRYDGCDELTISAWLGPGPVYVPQGPGDLGQRMSRALHEALQEGARRVVLVGSDIPALEDGLMERAFNLLESKQAVFGPSRDGGYYLIGLSAPAPSLFQAIDWGSERVLAQTLAAAEAAGLEHSLLPALADVDLPEDLPVWESAAPPPPEFQPGLISVVIPCLNEAGNLAATAASARTGGDTEIIVVDGGSIDSSPDIARKTGCLVLCTPPGRGPQLKAGAERAQGEYILFLHADTRLPPGWDGEVRRICNLPDVAAGAFTFKLDAPSASLRLIEIMVGLRSRWAQMPYGDQAIFIKTTTLAAMGGMPDLMFMEDVELIRRARRLGRIAISPLSALSSARSWLERGVWRNTLHNWHTFARYTLMKTPQERLVRHYYRRSSRGPAKSTWR